MTATKTHIIILLITILCPACRLNASMQANTEAEIMKSYADKQYEEGNFPGALSLYINSMEKAENEEDNDTYMACIGNIANIYEALGDYESNLFYLLKGYDISRRLNNNDLRNKYLTNIVAAYCNLGDVKKAKEFYEISKKATGSHDTVNHKYFLIYNSARIKQAEKKYDEAIAEHAKAERYAIDNGLDDIYALYQECETGNILIKKHDYGKAISQGRKCLEMAAAADNDLTSRINIYTLAVILVSTLLALTVVLTVVLVRKNRNLRNAQKLLINKNNDIMKSYRQSSPAIPTMPDGCRDNDADDDTDDDNSGGVEMTRQQIDELLEKVNTLTDRRDIISDPDLNLKTIADMAKSNTKYVSFAINKTYNKNFRTYINEKRIMEACRMLTDEEHYGHMTIQAIYEEVGYTNAVSFNRTFKKINGMTPAMYKKLAADNMKG